MDYLPNIAAQTRQFLLCLGFGFALGVVYDVFRVLRLLINRRGALALAVQDVLYCLLCTALSFFFFLSTGDGVLRFYSLLGEIIGWLIYYVSLGTVVLRCSEWVVKQLRKFFAALERLLRAPFLWMLRCVEKCSAKARQARLKAKKFEKNFIFGLHSSPKVLYNEKRGTAERKKENHRARKPRNARRRKEDSAAEPSGNAAAPDGLKKKPRGQHYRAGPGSGVRAVDRGASFTGPRGHGKNRNRK
jgi:spore cortex biosynthesis protein YabQ